MFKKGNKMALRRKKIGRPSRASELRTISYYRRITPKVFKYLNFCFKSKDEQRKKWACNYLRGGIEKTLPQITQEITQKQPLSDTKILQLIQGTTTEKLLNPLGNTLKKEDK